MSSLAGAASAPAARTALDEVSKDGSFQRTASTYHNRIGIAPFFAEEGRYHLYVAYACPWANRCLALRNLKGLQDVIGVSVVHPTWAKTRPEKDDHTGWVFKDPDHGPCTSSTGMGAFDFKDTVPDDVNGAKDVRELYEISNETTRTEQTGKFTVPILWDKKLRRIVSNESSEIVRMLNSEFNKFAKVPELDLYPENLRAKIDSVNEWVYEYINNGVYSCGFATSQSSYEASVKKLYEHMEKVEEILSKQRYIAGDQLTEADVRLFMTLVRFDEVYNVYFKCNCKKVMEYPNMLNYTRELFQWPGGAMAIHLDHIKIHYYSSHPRLNYYAIIPAGPGTEKILAEPHDRATKFPVPSDKRAGRM